MPDNRRYSDGCGAYGAAVAHEKFDTRLRIAVAADPAHRGGSAQYDRATAAKMRLAAAISAPFAGDKAVMKTLAVIFLLALGAVAGSVYTDELLTGGQAGPGAGELPMMTGQSHAPWGFR